MNAWPAPTVLIHQDRLRLTHVQRATTPFALPATVAQLVHTNCTSEGLCASDVRKGEQTLIWSPPSHDTVCAQQWQHAMLILNSPRQSCLTTDDLTDAQDPCTPCAGCGLQFFATAARTSCISCSRMAPSACHFQDLLTAVAAAVEFDYDSDTQPNIPRAPSLTSNVADAMCRCHSCVFLCQFAV
jgi:hypothetical protein